MSLYQHDAPPEDIIPCAKAARILKVHIASVHRAIGRGKLRGWRQLGRVYVSEAEVRNLWTRVVPDSEKPKPENLPRTRTEQRQTAAWVSEVLRNAGIG